MSDYVLGEIQASISVLVQDQAEILRRLGGSDETSTTPVSVQASMAADVVINRPGPVEVNGRKSYKIYQSHIVALIDPSSTMPPHQLDGVLGSIRKFRQRSVDTLRHQLRTTEHANKSWDNIPWVLRNPEVTAFENIVLAQTGVNFKPCQGNWAADHLLGTIWNNRNGHRRRR